MGCEKRGGQLMRVEGRRAKQRTGCAPGRSFTCVGDKTLCVEDQASYVEWCRHDLNDQLLIRLVHTTPPTPATCNVDPFSALPVTHCFTHLSARYCHPCPAPSPPFANKQVMRLVLGRLAVHSFSILPYSPVCLLLRSLPGTIATFSQQTGDAPGAGGAELGRLAVRAP